MVSSSLSCSFSAHLHQFADFGDIDGEELLQLKSQPFEAGYKWEHTVESVSSSDVTGVAVAVDASTVGEQQSKFQEAKANSRAYGRIFIKAGSNGSGAILKNKQQ